MGMWGTLSPPSGGEGEVKRIARLSPTSGSDCLRSPLPVEGLDHRLRQRLLANAINSVFLDPMKIFAPLAVASPFEPSLTVPTLSEVNVLSALSNVNPRKAADPPAIPSSVLKEYANIVAHCR